ncbi:MAG: ribonuclease H-like domain-containing protein, partial [Olpidium bornovanus]
YCANVCLKINVKIGGTNVILTPQDLPFFAELPTMVMGMDVAHPAPGDTTRPSIASVVGSVDKMGSSFTAAVRVQQARGETITDVGDMAKQVLRNFYQANRGVPPQRILIYRDGVSEGQFRITLNAEASWEVSHPTPDVAGHRARRLALASIRKACQELDAKYAPTITWIVAQKRHHTRFFPLQGGADKSGNCLPGTVVETGIVHPTEYDFYHFSWQILSHAGLQGTSRPTHYYVLHDENKLGADALQQMTYK